MSRYRKRPVVVEARGPLTEPEFVTTANGRVWAEAGDYVLLAESGDTWPIKPDIFAATYERVEEEPPVELKLEVEPHGYEAGARDMRERAAITVLQVRAKPETANNDWFPLRSRAAKEIRALPLRVEERP